MNDKKQRVALIVGVSSDIGMACAENYLRNGYDIIGTYHTKSEKIQSFVKDNNMTLYELNLEKQGYEEDFHKILKNYSQIDAFVFMPALLQAATFSNFSTETFYKLINVNYLSCVQLTRQVITYMLKNNFGRICWLSSVGTKFGGQGDSFIYSLSKYMLEFIPGEYKLWAKKNVFLNVIKVGVTNTKIHPLNKDLSARAKLIPIERLAEPHEIADFIYFLASHCNTYITGQVLPITGGE